MARPFVIPSGDELQAITSALDEAARPVEQLEMNLLHAAGRVDGEPLVEFGRRPTYEDIGALWAFAAAVRLTGENLVQWAAQIKGQFLTDVDIARMEFRDDDA